MILDFFRDPGPLVLPYSTSATLSNSAEAKEVLSRNPLYGLGYEEKSGPTLNFLMTLPEDQWTGNRRILVPISDSFGHIHLHAAFLSQDREHLAATVDIIGQEGPEKDIAAQSPSSASGLTPLACSATSLSSFNAFKHILTFSDGKFCREAGSGILSHVFCVLSILKSQRAATII